MPKITLMKARFQLKAVTNLITGAFVLGAVSAMAADYLSHPPIREMHPVSNRPMGEGTGYFVDPAKGDDQGPGTVQRPWKTIGAAMDRLQAGDTLYLRAGQYFENIYCAVAGEPEKPITIRAYPGERVIIDGGLPEFQLDPANAWTRFEEGEEDEYVSTKIYRNIRDVVGLFADSNIGLQTYWDIESFRASDEFDSPRFPKRSPGEMLNGYCGPGLWYNKKTGRIHIRLAHTHLPALPSYNYKNYNYRGETDPRKMPLVVAPFDSVPLFVDQAMHIRFQDIVFRGGGYKTLNLIFGVGLELDNCTIYCGTYGIWTKNTGPFKMTNCGVYGMIPPWGFRSENGLSVYSPFLYPPFLPDKAGKRHVSRLPTHAILVGEGGFEFETFYYPHNHHWEISNCEFTDAHDGVYLSGYDIHFHHNWVDTLQDDAIYISAPTPYFNHSVYIYQNYIDSGVSGIGAHSRGGPGGDVYVFRNIIDLRRPMQTVRPTPDKPEGTFWVGHSAYFRHGRKFLHGENLPFYQNTCLVGSLDYLGSMWNAGPGSKARLYNNLVLYREGYPGRFQGMVKAGNYNASKGHDIVMDGNLSWALKPGAIAPPDFLDALRKSEASQEAKKVYPEGWAMHSLAADPRLVAVSADPMAVNDYRLQPDSPTIGKGVPLPEEYMDPLRPKDDVRPDIGALPSGADQLRIGVQGRIVAGDLVRPEERPDR